MVSWTLVLDHPCNCEQVLNVVQLIRQHMIILLGIEKNKNKTKTLHLWLSPLSGNVLYKYDAESKRMFSCLKPVKNLKDSLLIYRVLAGLLEINNFYYMSKLVYHYISISFTW